MISAFLPVPLTADFSAAHYKPLPAVQQRADYSDRPWPNQSIGTGGLALAAFVKSPYGYRMVKVLESPNVQIQAPFAKLMQQVKDGFGRTMSSLPEAFGVSRQTLYNWLEGETPKTQHQARLKQLAKSAQVFTELGVKPTTAMLRRTLVQGKNFLQLIEQGEDGKLVAQKLIQITSKTSNSRDKLNTLLSNRKTKLEASDFGTPLFREDV